MGALGVMAPGGGFGPTEPEPNVRGLFALRGRTGSVPPFTGAFMGAKTGAPLDGRSGNDGSIGAAVGGGTRGGTPSPGCCVERLLRRDTGWASTVSRRGRKCRVHPQTPRGSTRTGGRTRPQG